MTVVGLSWKQCFEETARSIQRTAKPKTDFFHYSSYDDDDNSIGQIAFQLLEAERVPQDPNSQRLFEC